MFLTFHIFVENPSNVFINTTQLVYSYCSVQIRWQVL